MTSAAGPSNYHQHGPASAAPSPSPSSHSPAVAGPSTGQAAGKPSPSPSLHTFSPNPQPTSTPLLTSPRAPAMGAGADPGLAPLEHFADAAAAAAVAGEGETDRPWPVSLTRMEPDPSLIEPGQAYYKLQFGLEEDGFTYYIQKEDVMVGRRTVRSPKERSPILPPPLLSEELVESEVVLEAGAPVEVPSTEVKKEPVEEVMEKGDQPAQDEAAAPAAAGPLPDEMGGPPPPPTNGPNPDLIHDVDIDLGREKRVSRNHARLYWCQDHAQFCMDIFGRQGAWFDGRYRFKGSHVPLSHGVTINMGGRQFQFLLPPGPDTPDFFDGHTSRGDGGIAHPPAHYYPETYDPTYDRIWTPATGLGHFATFTAPDGHGLGLDSAIVSLSDDEDDDDSSGSYSSSGSDDSSGDDDEDGDSDEGESRRHKALAKPPPKVKLRISRAKQKDEGDSPDEGAKPGKHKGKQDAVGGKGGAGKGKGKGGPDIKQEINEPAPSKTKKGAKKSAAGPDEQMDEKPAVEEKKTSKKMTKKAARAAEAAAAAAALAASNASHAEIQTMPPVAELPPTLAAAIGPPIQAPTPPAGPPRPAPLPPKPRPIPSTHSSASPVPTRAPIPRPLNTGPPEIQRPFLMTELQETPGRPGHIICNVPIPPSGSGPRPAPGPLYGLDGQFFIGPPPIKPQETYAAIIFKALQNTPRGRGTLGEICNWIAGEWEWYRLNVDTEWQNSIRHNLSLSDVFVRVPRIEEDDPESKGSVWIIDPNKGAAFEAKQRDGGGKRGDVGPTVPVSIPTGGADDKGKAAQLRAQKERRQMELEKERQKRQWQAQQAAQAHAQQQRQAQQHAHGPHPPHPPHPHPNAHPHVRPPQHVQRQQPVPQRALARPPQPPAPRPPPQPTTVIVEVQAITAAVRAKNTGPVKDSRGQPMPFVCDGTTLTLDPTVFGQIDPKVLNQLRGLGPSVAVNVLSTWLDNKYKQDAAKAPPPPKTAAARQALNSTLASRVAAVAATPNRPAASTTTAGTAPAAKSTPKLPVGPAPPGASVVQVIRLIADVTHAKQKLDIVGGNVYPLFDYIKKVGRELDLQVADSIWKTGKPPEGKTAASRPPVNGTTAASAGKPPATAPGAPAKVAPPTATAGGAGVGAGVAPAKPVVTAPSAAVPPAVAASIGQAAPNSVATAASPAGPPATGAVAGEKRKAPDHSPTPDAKKVKPNDDAPAPTTSQPVAMPIPTPTPAPSTAAAAPPAIAPPATVTPSPAPITS